MSETAIRFEWRGGAMWPLRPYEARCRREFQEGEAYSLLVHEERSEASQGHYFACLSEAWSNLPEHDRSRFPTMEHLRKWALIRSGFHDVIHYTCASDAQAARMASFLARMNQYAIVDREGSVVAVYTAKSQSARKMGRLEFQRSKDAVLDVVARLIGVTAGELASNAGRAA